MLTGLLASASAFAQPAVTLTHVHGLSYSADGRQLIIPSHHGLAVYEGGKWSKAPGSGLVNPFGVIRSRDGGKTWDKLGFEGESDFHLLAARCGVSADARRIAFIQYAQQCGFSLADIAQLLEVRSLPTGGCGDVRRVATEKRLALEQRIGTLTAMAGVLDRLIAACNDSSRPLEECPILAAMDRAGLGEPTQSGVITEPRH